VLPIPGAKLNAPSGRNSQSTEDLGEDSVLAILAINVRPVFDERPHRPESSAS
jgi:hypothetical protein